MPYLKAQKQQNEAVSMLIRSYGLNPNRLAKILGCTQPTAQKRLNNPDEFTLGELFLISEFAHIPIEDIRCAAFKKKWCPPL